MASARIPADKPALGFSHDRVRAENQDAVAQRLAAADTADDDAELRRLRTFYRACMTANDRDVTLRRRLDRLDAPRRATRGKPDAAMVRSANARCVVW